MQCNMGVDPPKSRGTGSRGPNESPSHSSPSSPLPFLPLYPPLHPLPLEVGPLNPASTVFHADGDNCFVPTLTDSSSMLYITGLFALDIASVLCNVSACATVCIKCNTQDSIKLSITFLLLVGE